MNNTTKSIEYYNKVDNSNSETKALSLTKLINLYIHNKDYSNAKETVSILKSLYYKTDVYKKFVKEQKKINIILE